MIKESGSAVSQVMILAVSFTSKPSREVIVGDSLYFVNGNDTQYNWFIPEYPPSHNRLHARHPGKANILMGDMHVESVPLIITQGLYPTILELVAEQAESKELTILPDCQRHENQAFAMCC